MKYIIFTADGFGFPLAEHLQEEGKDVTVGRVTNYQDVYSDEEIASQEKESLSWKNLRLSIYKNIIDSTPAFKLVKRLKKVRNPENYFIFFDQNYLYKIAEELKDIGFHGIFPTKENRLFELDRNKAKNFVKQYYSSLNVAEHKEFNSIEQATNYISAHNKIWVLKSYSSELATVVPGTDNKMLSNKLIIDSLNVHKSEYERYGFLLEEKIVDAVEITPEKIYYDGKPLGTSILIENKHIGSANISYQIPCAGDIVFPTDERSKINEIAFPPIVDEMAKQHKGLFIWDASILISKHDGKMYFGEFCPNRVGYNSFFTELAQVPSVSYFFEQITKQKNPFIPGSFGASVSFFNIQHDSETNQIVKDISVLNTTDKNSKYNTWAFDIYKKNRQDTTRLVGYFHQVACITGSGKTLDESISNAYRNSSNFSFAEAYYRPKFDFTSLDYTTSILNRFQYAQEKKLFTLL